MHPKMKSLVEVHVWRKMMQFVKASLERKTVKTSLHLLLAQR